MKYGQLITDLRGEQRESPRLRNAETAAAFAASFKLALLSLKVWPLYKESELLDHELQKFDKPGLRGLKFVKNVIMLKRPTKYSVGKLPFDGLG